MLLNNLSNASHWPSLQHGDFIIYSSQLSLLRKLQSLTRIDKFWQQTYTPFAAVVVNTKTLQVIAVRDHFGVEPFYYAQDQNRFIFGSTLPDILNSLSVRPAWNTEIPLKNLFKGVFERQEIYTDETYYESIYRVTPGYELHLKFTPSTFEIDKINFWDLSNLPLESVYYQDDRDYLAHFTELLQEAIRTQNVDESVAVEFSGGLDSSAVLLASLQLGMNTGIVMNVGNKPEHNAEELLAQKLIQHYKLSNVDALGSQGFDLKSSMERYANCFAGPAPYIDPIINDVLYRTVSERKYKIVLSGVGGDECVSGHVPLHTCAWSLLKTQGLNAFFENIPSKSYRWLYATKSFFIAKGHWSELEYNMLQGTLAHHLRMRVEYKSLAARYWGFRYAFPLLYPKLVEFCYQFPLAQKRRGIINRWLIRHYLEQKLPLGWLNHRVKTGGIAPAVYEKIVQCYQSGDFNALFANLPFEIQRANTLKQNKIAHQYSFLLDIPAYMYKLASSY